MLTRRQFLERLAAIGLVTAAVPKIAATALLEDPKTLSMMQTPRGVLTLQMLEEAYQECTFGYDEPDLMVVSKDIYAEMRILVSNALKRFGHLEYFFPVTIDGEDTLCPKYNNAYVIHDGALPQRTWLNINSKGCEEKQRIKLEPQIPYTSAEFPYHDFLGPREIMYLGRDERTSGMFSIDGLNRIHRKPIPQEMFHVGTPALR